MLYIFYVVAGSKEETFFDSQAWLDSDCDDDFMSVNGGKKHHHLLFYRALDFSFKTNSVKKYFFF